jgi:sulfate transport system permease protein
MPLHVEILYNEYNFVAAFSVASLLALIAVLTLLVKKSAEWAVHVRSTKSSPSAAAPPTKAGAIAL